MKMGSVQRLVLEVIQYLWGDDTVKLLRSFRRLRCWWVVGRWQSPSIIASSKKTKKQEKALISSAGLDFIFFLY